MVEYTTPFRRADRIKNELEQIFAELDISDLLNQVEDFGKKNPFSLAIAALTLGVAAGMLVRQTTSRGVDLH